MNAYKSTYKSTSLDRKRKHLPHLPDDVFHLIMHYRNRLMRRDAVRQLRKEIESNKIEVNNLISELQDCGDEDEEEQLEEFIEDLQVEVATMRMRIIHFKELDDFWGLSQNRA